MIQFIFPDTIWHKSLLTVWHDWHDSFLQIQRDMTYSFRNIVYLYVIVHSVRFTLICFTPSDIMCDMPHASRYTVPCLIPSEVLWHASIATWLIPPDMTYSSRCISHSRIYNMTCLIPLATMWHVLLYLQEGGMHLAEGLMLGERNETCWEEWDMFYCICRKEACIWRKESCQEEGVMLGGMSHVALCWKEWEACLNPPAIMWHAFHFFKYKTTWFIPPDPWLIPPDTSWHVSHSCRYNVTCLIPADTIWHVPFPLVQCDMPLIPSNTRWPDSLL